MKVLFNLIILIITFFLFSCTNKINKNNYDKISNGMSVSEVESILGKGVSQASSNTNLGDFGGNFSSENITWQKGMNIISITFLNGKVMAKAQYGL
jgi:hypothetical protein